jgi:hypothetical protein
MIYALTMDTGQVITSLNVGQTNRFATPPLLDPASSSAR